MEELRERRKTVFLICGREREKKKGCSVVEGDWGYHAHHVRVDEVSNAMPRSLQGSKTPFCGG